MECRTDERNRPEARKRKAASKKFNEKRPLVTKGATKKEDKQACEPCRKSDTELSYSWEGMFPDPTVLESGVGTGMTSPNFPDSSLSSSSCSSLSSNIYEISSQFYGEGSGDVRGGTSAFFDEEEVFNVHGLLDGMAEGLMVSPFGCGLNWGGVDYVDLTLWSSDD